MREEIVFKAMADTTRLRLLEVLGKQELNVSELVEVLRQPQSTVSRHLRTLREAGLIIDRRDGTNVLCSLAGFRGNGGAQDLRGQVLEWVQGQPVPSTLRRRLERVLHRRTERSRGFFEEVGQRWDHIRTECFGNRFHLEALTALLPSDWTVADLGTGTGYLLPVLAGTFRRVIAVEPVSAMLKAARTRPELAGVQNVDFREGDLSELPIADGEVDAALAVLVLHHVPTPPGALLEMRRVVRPGGTVLIVEQDAHELAEFHERMQDRWWGFEPNWLREQVKGAGFADVCWRRLDTAEASPGPGMQAPDLYVMTAC
jgi:ubiquinone/menaquinone biosynthesis C-methylase UbiE/DNA-binding transcriptional ArsR family regulator